MDTRKPLPIQRDWVAKSLAGTLLGFGLALCISGLFVRLNPGMALPVKGQLAMWMLPPIWLGTLAGSYFFSSGQRAWLWLGGANLLLAAVLAAISASSGA